MKFVLVRHAQKDFQPIEDPVLNDKGFLQAEKLCDLVKKNNLPLPTELWCSDRIRTRQTLEKMAQEFNLKFQQRPELNLRDHFESGIDFRIRLQKLVSDISSGSRNSSIIFACTHFDVIEELMTLIPSDTDLTSSKFSHWAPTQFMVFEIVDGLWQVTKAGAANEV